jgi:Ca2+/Na+ antiporter
MVQSGTGFVIWFEIYVYNKIRNACKNIIIKIFVHLIGLIFMMVGIYYLIAAIPSFTSIFGMFLSFAGLVIFLIPIGVCTE